MRNYLDVDDLLTRWGIWRSQGVKVLSIRARQIFSSLPSKRIMYSAKCDHCHGYSVEYCRQCRGSGTVKRTYDAVDPRLISATDGGQAPVEYSSPPREYKRIDQLILGMPVSLGACLTANYVYYPGKYQHQRRIAWANERLELANLESIETDLEFRKLLRQGKQIIAQVYSLPVSQFSEIRRTSGSNGGKKSKRGKSESVVIHKIKTRETLHLPGVAK